MKITYLELLEMIRDGKAPEKVKYLNKIYEFSGGNYRISLDYVDKFLVNKMAECNEFSLSKNKCIEIIQEEEFEEIYKLEDVEENYNWDNESITRTINTINHQLHQLIDNQNKMNKKLEEK